MALSAGKNNTHCVGISDKCWDVWRIVTRLWLDSVTSTMHFSLSNRKVRANRNSPLHLLCLPSIHPSTSACAFRRNFFCVLSTSFPPSPPATYFLTLLKSTTSPHAGMTNRPVTWFYGHAVLMMIRAAICLFVCRDWISLPNPFHLEILWNRYDNDTLLIWCFGASLDPSAITVVIVFSQVSF